MRRLWLGIAVLLTAATTADATTTLDRRVVPGPPAANGYVPLTYGPGEPTVTQTGLAAAKAGREKRRRSLLYFAQLSDFQLADEESPLRVEVLDQVNPLFSSAWRPQEALVPFLIDASIRQVNANLTSPIRAGGGERAKLALTILTGDNADNQERVEVDWVDDLLDGGRVDPNTGRVTDASLRGSGCNPLLRSQLATEAPKYTGVQDYDDYVESGTFYDPDVPTGQWAFFPRYTGLMDRAQRPFQATGLKVPAFVAVGNHDLLVQGNQAATAALERQATGCVKTIGPAVQQRGLLDPIVPLPPTSDPTKTMFVPPDPARAPVTPAEYRALLDDKHGFQHIDAAEKRASRGASNYYSYSPRKGVRLVALDSVANGGVTGPNAEGNIDDPQLRWLARTLDAAKKADELVFLYSHHAPVSLTANIPDEVAGDCDDPRYSGDAGCDRDPRASTPVHLGDELVDFVLARPNVVGWIGGHSHVNDVQAYRSADKKRGFYVVRTSAEADYPHQDRLLEIMDNRDGTLSLFGTLLEGVAPPQTPPSGADASKFTNDQLASIARTFGFNDPQGNRAALGERADRNFELLLPDPRRSKGATTNGSGKAKAKRSKLRVQVRPKRVRAGRRTVLRVRVRRAGKPVRRARVRIRVRGAQRTRRTDRRGRARFVVRLHKRGRHTVRVRKGARRAKARFRVVSSKG